MANIFTFGREMKALEAKISEYQNQQAIQAQRWENQAKQLDEYIGRQQEKTRSLIISLAGIERFFI